MIEPDFWNVLLWLITNSVIAGLLAGLAYFTDRVVKRPTLAHLLWVLVLIKLVAPPMVVLPIAVDASRFEWIAKYTTLDYQRLMKTNAAAVADSIDHARMTGIGQSFGAQPLAASAWSISTIGGLMCIWVAGTVGLSVWIVVAARRLEMLIQRLGRFDISATRQLAELRGPSEGPTPPVWLVDAVVSPMLVGARRDARIVFPTALWSRLSEDARAALLLHELEHWLRRDWLVRRVEVIAMAILWWHPLVWIAKRQIEDCEERCCDLAASRRASSSPRVYAEAILATLDFLSEPGNWNRRNVGPLPLASGIGYLPRIEQRLREIMSPTANRQSRRTQKSLVLVAMIFVIPIYPSIVLHRTVAKPNGSSEFVDVRSAR
jgi:beta-lactamase regulating signal transducer with metallopeptidase domain